MYPMSLPTPPAPKPASCPHCGKLIPACDADLNGCGTGEAKEAAPAPAPPSAPPVKQNQSWRDREPLL
jgi:hypothetical protein